MKYKHQNRNLIFHLIKITLKLILKINKKFNKIQIYNQFITQNKSKNLIKINKLIKLALNHKKIPLHQFNLHHN
jgi:hypothetical protein